MSISRFFLQIVFLSVIFYPKSLNAAVGHNSTSNATEEIGRVKLAAYHIEEFETFFAVLLSLMFITLFKMFYPLIPCLPNLLPQSLALIALGVVFGLLFSTASTRKLEETLWKLTPSMFFHFLLPPIILEAAYSLFNRNFFDFLGSIVIYAVIGTVLNFLIIGPVMYCLDRVGAMGSLDVHVSLYSYLLFASVIVAVDPVAVLAIFQDIGVEPGLYFMVFGESLLNDGVTIVLFAIMREFVGMTYVDSTQVGIGVMSFVTISLGGLLVGVAFGIVTSFFTRWTPNFGSVFIILMAYFSYIMADCLGWSGIMSMIACGLVQADYAFHNISAASLSMLRKVVKEMSEVSEAFTFFLIGVQLFSTEIEWNTGICLWGLTICLFSRTVVVLALTYVINRINLNNMRVTFREQIILIYGGLRGAVAFSLALLIDHEKLGGDGQRVRRMFVTATLFIIIITVGVMGSTMKYLVKRFHIKLAQSEQLSLWTDLNENLADHALAGVESIIGNAGRNRLREIITRFDNRYIRQVLQRDPATHDQRIIKTYEKIALKLHYATMRPSQSSGFLEGLPEVLKKRHYETSGIQLAALDASASDPRLQDFFNSNSSNSAENETNDENNDESEPLEWRKRTSLVDNGKRTEEFQHQFLSNMKLKERIVKRLSALKRSLSEKKIEVQEPEEDDDQEERMRDLETAENTARNGRVINIPPRDYPKDSKPRFHIGEDDDE